MHVEEGGERVPPSVLRHPVPQHERQFKKDVIASFSRRKHKVLAFNILGW